MLKKEHITAIAKLLKLDEAAFTTALADPAEVDVIIPDGLTAFTTAELDTYGGNKYNEGKKAGVEIEVKAAREELKLDFTGKTVKNLLEAHSKKVLEEAKIPEAQKVTELTGQLETLKGTVTELNTKLGEKDKQINGISIKSEVFKHIPALGKDSKLNSEDVLTLLTSAGYEFKSPEDGKPVAAYLNGKLQANQTLDPLPLADVIKPFVISKGLIIDEGAAGGGGRGKGNEGGGKSYSKLSEIKEDFKAQKKSDLGAEFAEATKAAQAANPDFKMDE